MRSRSPCSRRSRNRSPRDGPGKDDRRSLSDKREDTSTDTDQSDVDNQDSAQDSKKKGLIRRLVWMYMKATPELSEAACLRITEKAKVFGAGPLFNQILPLLKSPDIQEKQIRLLFELTDKILCELGDLIRPSIKKILMGIEPLLIHETTYAREESKKITSRLAKVSSISKKRMRILKAKKQLELLKKTNERLEEEMKAASKSKGQTGPNTVDKARTTAVSPNQAIKRTSEQVRAASSSSDASIKRRRQLGGDVSPVKLRKTSTGQAEKATRHPEQNLKRTAEQGHTDTKSTDRVKQRKMEPGKAAKNSPNPEKKFEKESAKATSVLAVRVKLEKKTATTVVKSENRAKKLSSDTVKPTCKPPERANQCKPPERANQCKPPERANQHKKTAAKSTRKSPDRVNERRRDSATAGRTSPDRVKARKTQPDRASSKSPNRSNQRRKDPTRAARRSPGRPSQRKGPGGGGSKSPDRAGQRRGNPISSKSPDRPGQHRRQSGRSASRSPVRAGQHRRDLRRAASRSPNRAGPLRRNMRRAVSRSPERAGQRRREIRRASSKSPDRAGQRSRDFKRTASKSPDRAGQRRERAANRSPEPARPRRRQSARARSKSRDRTSQPKREKEPVKESATLKSTAKASNRGSDTKTVAAKSSDQSSKRKQVDETPAKKTTNVKPGESTTTHVTGPANPDASASGDAQSMESLLETQMKALKWLMSKTDEESTALLISGDKVGVSPKPIPVLCDIKRQSRFDVGPGITHTAVVSVPLTTIGAGNVPVVVTPLGVSPSTAPPAGQITTIITTSPTAGSTPVTAQQSQALQWLLPKTPEQMKTWKWTRKPDAAKTVISEAKLPASSNKTTVKKEKTLNDVMKEKQITKLLQMYLNGTANMTMTTCRRITDRAKEFGADPLLSQILPLLTSSYIQSDDMRLLFQLINKIMSQLGDLIKPCVQKILDGIESLLIHKNALARDESRKIVERLAKFSRDKTKISPDTCSSRQPNR